MSLIIYNNAVYLPPYNLGVIIKNIDNNTVDKNTVDKNTVDNNTVDNNTVWVKGDLHAYDLTKKKTYKVLIHRINNKSVLLKPIKPYYCYVFEHMFDFGYKCDEFSKNRIINIYTD